MKITMIGIDLAKNVFQLHGVNAQGKTVLKKTVTTFKNVDVLCQPPALLYWYGSVWRRALLGASAPALWS